MEQGTTLQQMLDLAIKSTETDKDAVASFVTAFIQKQAQDLENTKDVAKKLSDGLKKYKNAHANLKSALSAVDE